jgi:hypothetical protein
VGRRWPLALDETLVSTRSRVESDKRTEEPKSELLVVPGPSGYRPRRCALSFPEPLYLHRCRVGRPPLSLHLNRRSRSRWRVQLATVRAMLMGTPTSGYLGHIRSQWGLWVVGRITSNEQAYSVPFRRPSSIDTAHHDPTRSDLHERASAPRGPQSQRWHQNGQAEFR